MEMTSALPSPSFAGEWAGAWCLRKEIRTKQAVLYGACHLESRRGGIAPQGNRMHVICVRGVQRGRGRRWRDDCSRFDASFWFDRMEPDEIEGDVLEDGEMARSCFGAGAPRVVVERHIHDPVQSVLDRPVRADGLTDAFGAGGQSADIQAPFPDGFVADGAFRFEPGEGAHAFPLLRLVETLPLIEDGAAGGFDAAVILFYGRSPEARFPSPITPIANTFPNRISSRRTSCAFATPFCGATTRQPLSTLRLR